MDLNTFRLIVPSCLVVMAWSNAYAQSADYRKMPSLGAHLFYNNFQTARPVRSDNMEPGLAISYMQGLHNHFDLSSALSVSFPDYTFKGTVLGQNKALLEWDVMIYGKLLSDKHRISPYLSAGAGISKYTTYYGAFIPVGTGVQFHILNKAFLLFNAQYRIRAVDKAAPHFYYSIGITGNIVRKRKSTIRSASGTARAWQMPVADDRDNDGITDNNDKCPSVPGLARYAGCPAPDKDGDNVNNKRRLSDTELNKQVLEDLQYAARNVFFSTGSAELLRSSEQALDLVVHLLVVYPEIKIAIHGHTDNEGTVKSNRELSFRRAEAVKEYLIEKGVSSNRLTSTGHGQMDPVAENTTPDGRAQNRRVEFKIKY